jgi:hypothetical protein
MVSLIPTTKITSIIECQLYAPSAYNTKNPLTISSTVLRKMLPLSIWNNICLFGNCCKLPLPLKLCLTRSSKESYLGILYSRPRSIITRVQLLPALQLKRSHPPLLLVLSVATHLSVSLILCWQKQFTSRVTILVGSNSIEGKYLPSGQKHVMN